MIRQCRVIAPLLKSSVVMLSLLLSAAPALAVDALAVSERAWQITQVMEKHLGNRLAGTYVEEATADVLASAWQEAGLNIEWQTFEFEFSSRTYTSRNLWVTIDGASDRHVLIGGHYDSAGQVFESNGTTDNGISVALMVALAEYLVMNDEQPPFTLTFALFGAEELGMHGSQAFVRAGHAENVDAMVNLDTIAGGDLLYIHSAPVTPSEHCADASTYSASAELREELIAVSEQAGLAFVEHPGYPGYAPGETGDWSDQRYFACSGIPIAYVEASNFSINGKEGHDGYSQTTHEALWDCYDAEARTACNRDEETQWGKIIHTRNDQLERLLELFGNRVPQQLHQSSQLLAAWLDQ
ncbi:M20/M25/M40 family metallo-hydrolase [Saccharospirillum sp. HFRX-1]|uniref:M28 family metallopeptidase n=1 Tax=unclassified Saccharospirillum TaxID=2633430 RepID=UPI003719ED45